MSRLLIDGGHRLNGEIAVHGAKNAVLPLLAATLLADGESLLHNVPALSDVDGCLEILQQFGCRIRREGGTVAVSPNGADRPIISDALMRKMRSSIVFLGAMMARFGEAYLSYPGGCELGPRPIDLHLSALRQMGAEIIERRGQLRATLPNGRFRGCTVSLAFPSVGATENVLLAAVTAEGTTTLLNAAREPEIADLAAYLSACGADIRIDGGTVTVRGVPRLTAAEHTVMPDRIEAATYLAAAAVTEGRVTVTDLCPAHIATILPIFSEMGCQLKTSADSVTLEAPPRLKRIPYLRTMPYPGFPTDAAAPLHQRVCGEHLRMPLQIRRRTDTDGRTRPDRRTGGGGGRRSLPIRCGGGLHRPARRRGFGGGGVGGRGAHRHRKIGTFRPRLCGAGRRLVRLRRPYPAGVRIIKERNFLP